VAAVEWVASERECLAHTEPGLKGQSTSPNNLQEGRPAAEAAMVERQELHPKLTEASRYQAGERQWQHRHVTLGILRSVASLPEAFNFGLFCPVVDLLPLVPVLLFLVAFVWQSAVSFR
jgi:photosystem II PsbK protein